MTGPLPPFSLGRLPRVTFGSGTISRLPEIVAAHGRRVLLVTGAGSFARTDARTVLEDGFRSAGIVVTGAVRVAGEPALADVEAPVRRYRDAGVEVVLGIGGGSAIDTAKAIAGLLRSGTSLLDHLEGVGQGLPYTGPAVPMVAVPTTAGTGSEATRNAVIMERGQNGYKRSFRDERLVPADAVLDPDLLAGLPPHLIAANGLDALTQLLESFTSLRATPITDALARSGLLAARRGLLAWHAEPEGTTALVARGDMAYAALLSGVCLANAGLGAVHGLASPLGAQLPIPHGVACGAVLWQTVRMNIAALQKREPDSPALGRYAELGRLLADLPGGASDEEARSALVTTLRRWVERLAVPGLAAFGLTHEGIAAVVADSAGSSMRTNPVALTSHELGIVLAEAL